jgi:hypothetical protein
LSTLCVGKIAPASPGANCTSEFSAWTRICTCRFAVIDGVTLRMIPVCRICTVARGTASAPPTCPGVTALAASRTRTGTCVPAVRLAVRLLSVTTLGSDCTSRSDVSCNASRKVVKSNLPMAVE